MSTPIESVATTTSGRVRGLAVDGIACYRGVPYAAPPKGPRRFALAAPAPTWDGVRDATRPGSMAPQHVRRFPGIDMRPLLPETGWTGDHDYLHVNIWTPQHHDGGLPVMVYIHGGAFIAGAADCPAFDGSSFARSGVVLMTVSYRLGAEGYSVLPDAPTNLGLRDQIAALQWVQNNAGAFGGDPGNVTVFGESAGAMSIATLLNSRAADGLFRRAIVQSGHDELPRDAAVGRRLTERIAAILSVPATAAAFREVPVPRLLDAQATLLAQPLDLADNGRDPAYGAAAYGMTIDNDVACASRERLTTSSVDLLVGTTKAEMNLYGFSSGDLDAVTDTEAVARLAASHPHARQVLAGYGLGQPGAKPGRALVDALTDLLFRSPARRLALRHGGPTYVYEFEWESPAFDGRLGACHGLDLPFVFHTLKTAQGPQGLVGGEPPVALADAMHESWVRFAHTGDPGWAPYGPGRRLMRFGGAFGAVPSRLGEDEAPLAHTAAVGGRASDATAGCAIG